MGSIAAGPSRPLPFLAAFFFFAKTTESKFAMAIAKHHGHGQNATVRAEKRLFFKENGKVRKRGGVQKSMGNKAPSKTGMLIYLPVTQRPLISLCRKKQFYHLVTSRPPI